MSDLERDLRDLAAAIDFPATPDLSARVRGRLAERERVYRHRWIAIAVAVAALAMAVGLAVPDARTAIFRFLHVGSVRIEFVERLPQVQPARPLDLGEPISPTAATVGRLLHSELLGAPDGVYRSGEISQHRHTRRRASAGEGGGSDRLRRAEGEERSSSPES